MYAVIESGGKQHRVAPGEDVALEKLPGEVGDSISFDKVLLTADGDNGEWVTQDVVENQPRHGHGALLYFDHLFTFGGVKTEDLGDEPDVMNSAADRLEFYEPLEIGQPLSDTLVQGGTSSNASFDTPRAYYKMVRLNGYLFAVAGNDGGGPLRTIERVRQ